MLFGNNTASHAQLFVLGAPLSTPRALSCPHPPPHCYCLLVHICRVICSGGPGAMWSTLFSGVYLSPQLTGVLLMSAGWRMDEWVDR